MRSDGETVDRQTAKAVHDARDTMRKIDTIERKIIQFLATRDTQTRELQFAQTRARSLRIEYSLAISTAFELRYHGVGLSTLGAGQAMARTASSDTELTGKMIPPRTTRALSLIQHGIHVIVRPMPAAMIRIAAIADFATSIIGLQLPHGHLEEFSCAT